jgi:hypothetical protein
MLKMNIVYVLIKVSKKMIIHWIVCPFFRKQCILSESRFDFLKDLVKTLPDVTTCDLEDGAGQAYTSVPPSNSVGKSDTARWEQHA